MMGMSRSAVGKTKNRQVLRHRKDNLVDLKSRIALSSLDCRFGQSKTTFGRSVGSWCMLTDIQCSGRRGNLYSLID